MSRHPITGHTDGCCCRGCEEVVIPAVERERVASLEAALRGMVAEFAGGYPCDDCGCGKCSATRAARMLLQEAGR